MSACPLHFPCQACFGRLQLLLYNFQLTINGLLGGLEVQAHTLVEAVPTLAGGLLLLALEATAGRRRGMQGCARSL